MGVCLSFVCWIVAKTRPRQCGNWDNNGEGWLARALLPGKEVTARQSLALPSL